MTSRYIIKVFHRAMRKMRLYQPVINRYISHFEKDKANNKHSVDFLNDLQNQAAPISISDTLITITVDNEESQKKHRNTNNSHRFASLEDEAAFYSDTEPISLFDIPEENETKESSEIDETEEMEFLKAWAEAIKAIPDPSSDFHKSSFTKAWIEAIMSIPSDLFTYIETNGKE